MFNAAINDDPTVYAIPIFIACILVEAFIDFRSRTNLYHKKDSAASISMGLGVVVIGLVTKTFYFFVFSLIYLNSFSQCPDPVVTYFQTFEYSVLIVQLNLKQIYYLFPAIYY